MILDRIDGPQDLKSLSPAELEQLAGEIRAVIIDTVAKTGGHLAASLGAVELAIALHVVFDSPRDKIVWDVGHQSYAHKLLTGRRDRFATLRRFGGLSGFPKLRESPHDHFGTGHSSTSISAALGMAKARDLTGRGCAVVAVIGDGAMTGGMAFEAIDHAGHDGTDLIVVLNDNRMSIAPNVGAMSSYLTRLRTGPAYNRFKADIEETLRRIPRIGPRVAGAMERVKDSLKHLVVPGQLFEELGWRYYGPIDGHDLALLQSTLRSARQKGGPVLIHAVTQKGRGYSYAEDSPDQWHGAGPFEVGTGRRPRGAELTYTEVFADTICRLAEADPRIVAITAAMPDGTGLSGFKARFPDRFFDVGIAEQHAITFAAGLATQGLRPVVAVYSTFLQRAVDQVIHDVCLQSLPVTLAVDRGGIVGDDGETHHGVFDFSLLRSLPGICVMSPRDEEELARMLVTAVSAPGPVAIRYPRGKGPGTPLSQNPQPLPIGRGEVLRQGTAVSILAIGAEVEPALQAAATLEAEGVSCAVADGRFVKPLDGDLVDLLVEAGTPLLTVEDHAAQGGFGSAVLEYLASRSRPGAVVRCLGVGDAIVPQGSISELKSMLGLDAMGIAQAARELASGVGAAASRATGPAEAGRRVQSRRRGVAT